MVRALLLALEQLSDPAAQRLVVRCVLLALATFAGLTALAGFGLAALDVTGIVWLDAAMGFAGSALALLLAWLLFPATVILISSLFVEQVADAVERRHYPALPAAPGLPLAEGFQSTLKLVAAGVALNLLALPLYLIPGANIFIFLGLNGYLLGREYFETVAQRRYGRAATVAMRRQLRVPVFLSGVVIAMMLTIPLLNLIAPVVATAFMVHRFERWRDRVAPATIRPAPDSRTARFRPTGDGSV